MTDKFKLLENEESLLAVSVFLKNNRKRFHESFTPEQFISMFNDNELVIPKCDKYGNRLHTKVSSLPKTLRKHLYIEGFEKLKLASVDFKNSQPFIFGHLNYKLLGKHIPDCHQAIEILKRHLFKSDFKHYSMLTQEGKLYEDFVENINNEFNSSVTRDEAKKMFMYVLYCNYFAAEKLIKSDKLKFEPVVMFNSKGEGTDEFKAQCYYVFKKYYPSVHQCITEMKKLNWRSLSTSKSIHYSQNCLLSQKYESALVYREISPSLIENKHYYYTTVHDSFICFAKDAKSIERLITDKFKAIGQVVPKFDIEYYV